MRWPIFEKSVAKHDQPPAPPKEELGINLPSDKKSTSRVHVSDVSREQKESSDPSIDFVFENPEVDSYTRIGFSIPDYEGRELRPGHRLLFKIPEEFKNRIVRDVILRHRKDSKYAVNIGSDGYDPNGAYSRVELHNSDSGQWTGWSDPAGYRTDKFAEPRSAGNPEEEVLHDWIATVGPISADSVRVTNVGASPDLSVSNVHGLEVVFYPEFKAFDFKERIYTLNTKFVDLDKGDLLPSYGAGEFNEGRYEGSVALNQSSRSVLFELNKDPGEEARVENGRLIIKLDSGKELMNVEVAIGDTEHLRTINPETRRNMRLGWAKLWVGVRRAKTGQTEWFVKNANIPPQGVIAGGPHLENSKIELGDELILESRADTSYVMGWRLAYK